MVTTFLLVTGMLFVVLLVTVLHLPLWLQRIILWSPAWLQAALVHIVYGGYFIGGVTGHVVGGLLAVPWFFVCKYLVQPWIARQLADAWTRNPVRRTVVRVYRRASSPSTVLMA